MLVRMVPPPECLERAQLPTPPGPRARFALFGLNDEDCSLLMSMRGALAAPTEAFTEGFCDHIRRFEETALLLGSEGLEARLKTVLRRHFDELTAGTYDERYVAARMKIGTVHHRAHIPPKWYVGAYARYLDACIPAITGGADRRAAIRCVQTLIRIVFFDASLALESWGRVADRDLSNSEGKGGAGVQHPTGERSFGLEPSSRPQVDLDVDRLAITDAELASRAAYVGLTARDSARLREVDAVLGRSLESVVDSFHERVLTRPEVARYFDDVQAIGRLRKLQLRYWREALAGEYGRAYALARMRVGHVHNRIGLPPYLHLVGLGHQLAELARLSLEHGCSPEALRAICRVVFFDLMLVLEIYPAVRVDKLLERPNFALELLSRMPTATLVVDPYLRVTSASDSVTSLIGGDSAALPGRDIRDVLAVPGLGESLDRVARGLTDQADLVSEIASEARLSRVVRVRVVGLGDRDAGRRSLAVLLSDVSLLIAIGDRAYASEHRWRSLVRKMDGLVWEMDATTETIELIGGRGLPALGLPADHFLGRPGEWRARMPAKHRERWTNAVAALTDTRPTVTVEHRMSGSTGRSRWLMSIVRRDQVDARTVLKALTVDITERRLMRIALRDRLREERVLNDLVRGALILQCPAELAAHACKSLFRIRGVLVSACSNIEEGESVHAWLGPNHPVSLSSTWRSVLQQRKYVEIRKGEDSPLVTSAMLDELGVHAVLVMPVVARRDRFCGALLVGFRGRLRAWRGVARLLRTIAVVLAQTVDQREHERRDERRRRLEALGELAAGVAHDLGNVLAAIQSQVEIAQLAGVGSAGAKQELRAIAETSARGSELVKQILAFARPPRSGLAARRFGAAVERAVALVRRALPGDVELVLRVTSEARVRMDATPLERLLLNLCKNAADAMGGRGVIEVEVCDADRAGRFAGIERSEHVVELRVRDHGAGVDHAPLERLTQPFFTTRAKGTGLGLTIVEAIVAAHDGVLMLEAAAGGGALARVQLPAMPPGGAVERRVMVLDDDLLRLDALRRDLVSSGLEVTACSNADAALAAIPERNYELDALVVRRLDPRSHEKLVWRWPHARTIVIGGHPLPRESSHVSIREGATNSEIVAEVLAALDQ